jgi:hypothetical protein
MKSHTLAVCLFLTSVAAHAEPVTVLNKEGLVHGFLSLRTLEGEFLADGELLQTVKGDRVTSRLIFRFVDGSLVDETAVYSQRGQFRLISNHLIQKGPSFPKPVEMWIDTAKGKVTIHAPDKDGVMKVDEDLVKLPADLANGLVLTLLKNVGAGGPKTMSMVAGGTKPRIVKLVPSVGGIETFKTGGTTRKATHYVVKVELGGVAGVVAPIIGKDPPDAHVWILEGAQPAFVKSEAPMFEGGPLWRIELVSPVWPKEETAKK